MLLALLIRLWASPGARSSAFWLLNASLAITLVGDVLWNFSVVATGLGTSAVWNDVLWLIAYVGIAAACWSPTIQLVSEPLPERDQPGISQTRVIGLAAGLLLPAITLLLDGFTGGAVRWAIVGIGSLALSVLVVARMANLIGLVQVQAVQLAALARSDALTGAPNRRTWDFELSRACQRRTTRQAHRWWSRCSTSTTSRGSTTRTATRPATGCCARRWPRGPSQLERRRGARAGTAARSSPCCCRDRPSSRPATASTRCDAATPGGQTFSAGVAMWNPATEPSEAVAAADRAMYDAKRTGRNRVCAPDMTGVPDHLPDPSIVLQPIVDLRTGRPVAMEALSRFPEENPIDGLRSEPTAPATDPASRPRPSPLRCRCVRATSS